jgi:two-component system, cell cycle sensor histidine kinase and response regulator CckA
MTSIDRWRNGCPVQAVVWVLFLGCFRASACTQDALWHESGASFAFVVEPTMAAVYGLCAIVLVVMAMAAARWAQRWRRRAFRQRKDEVFQQIDEWTKRLQHELAAQKQAQRVLQERHELSLRQERLTAVGQLTAGLAHQFNNIMTIVQGHASLLMDNTSLDEESAKSLAHITDSIERMAKLIRQMLAFSRKQVMQQKPMDVRETLGLSFDMLDRMLGDEVALRFELAPNLPPILADWEMFQQIMVNLVINGRDAMSGGGQLTIRAAEASFTAADTAAKPERQAGRFVRVSVIDGGCGMDSAVIHRLFEPFFTTKEIGKGTGLGLASVYGMVQQHQGWIEVESRVGQGTTFDLYFPVTDQAPQRPVVAATPLEVRGGQETVLVVEDESVLRALVREILTAQGYRFLEAADGVEALNVWDEHRDKVDLLLTDIAMPRGLSGRDLAERLRKDDPRLPVIFSSGYSQEMIARSDDAVRGATYLAKPYRPAQLAQAVREALDAAQKRDASVAAPAS